MPQGIEDLVFLRPIFLLNVDIALLVCLLVAVLWDSSVIVRHTIIGW